MSPSTRPSLRLSARMAQRNAAPTVPPGSRAKDVIFLGNGVPDPRLHPAHVIDQLTTQLLHESTDDTLGYCRGRGRLDLREAIAERAGSQGVETQADDIVITGGAAGALTLAAQALIDPGDVVLVEEKTYPGAVATFRQAGAEVLPLPIDSGGVKIADMEGRLSELKAQGISPKFAYVMPNNQSPTTCNMPHDRRLALGGLAERYDFLVLHDDTYGDLWYEGEAPGSLRRYNGDRTAHIGSFSKTLAPGLRLGWIAAPPSLADAMQRSRTDLGTGCLNQRVVAEMLTSGFYAKHLEEITRTYRRKRDLVLAGLEKHCAGLASWSVPPGGLFLWVEAEAAGGVAFERHAHEEGISVLPGSFFDVHGQRCPAMRLAFGELAEEELQEGVTRLARALRRAAGVDSPVST